MSIYRNPNDYSDEHVAYNTKLAETKPYTDPEEVVSDSCEGRSNLFCIPSCQIIRADFKPEEASAEILDYAKSLVGRNLTQLQAEKLILAFAENEVLPRYARAGRLEYLASVVPMEYNKPIIRGKLSDPTAHDLVLRWAENPGERGLFLVGFTGTGKTRSAYAALKKFHLDTGEVFKAVTCNELKSGYVDHSFEEPGSSEGLSNWMRKFLNSAVLFLDDITQTKLTKGYTEKFFEIFEYRTRNGYPMFITSQLEGLPLIARLAGTNREFIDTAECIERRIRDYCDIIRFSQPKASGRRKV